MSTRQGGGGGREEQLPGSKGARAPRPRAKWTPGETKAQKMTGIGAEHRERGGTKRRGWTRGGRTPRGRQEPGCRPRAKTGGRMTRDIMADAGTRRGAQSELRRLAGGGCG